MTGSTASVGGLARAAPDRVFDISTRLDPAKFYRKFGPLPAVTEVGEQSGPWDTVGRTRRLLLSDGGSVIETITDVAAPAFFAYELSDFQRLFGRLVSGARTEWRYEPVGDGTRISWTYSFFPLPGAGLVVRAIVRLFWRPYMKRVLPNIIAELDRVACTPN